MTNHVRPPFAPPRPHSFTRHGVTIEDSWAWLRDPAYPDVADKDVLSYLAAENAWFETAMAPRKPLIDTLFHRGRWFMACSMVSTTSFTEASGG